MAQAAGPYEIEFGGATSNNGADPVQAGDADPGADDSPDEDQHLSHDEHSVSAADATRSEGPSQGSVDGGSHQPRLGAIPLLAVNIHHRGRVTGLVFVVLLHSLRC